MIDRCVSHKDICSERRDTIMKRRIALLMVGVMIGLTACGTQQIAEAPAEQTQEAPAAETQTAPETAENTEAVTEQGEYIEDTVISADLYTVTIPDEFKGKFLAKVDGNEISIFHKDSVEAGFSGFVFSVIVDKDNSVVAGGMYTKVGEYETSDGQFYDVCKSYASEATYDYNLEQAPEDFTKLYDAADDIIASATANNGGVFMYGAGTKGEDLYAYTVSKYVSAFEEGWDANKFEEEGLSPEFYALYKSEGEKAFDKIGFDYKDISNDGVDELLVGIIGENNEPSVVYDIYTIVDRMPALVCSGTARNSYRAMEFGGVANVFSGGAMENGINVYIIEPGTNNLFLQYGIKYDAYTNESNPWYTNASSGDDEDKWEEATEEDYNMWYDRAAGYFLQLDFTPFSDITPIDYSKVDLSKYGTFTNMIDDFKPGMGYANEKVGDTDVFFVSIGCYNGENETKNAIDSSLFVYDYDADKIAYIGQVYSAGTAYPVTITDGYIFVGGHHNVFKYTVRNNKLVVAEEASEVFDTNGNATYYYGADGAKAEEVKDDSNLTRLFDEYFTGKPVEYSVVQ